jgi:hypothetical protein
MVKFELVLKPNFSATASKFLPPKLSGIESKFTTTPLVVPPDSTTVSLPPPPHPVSINVANATVKQSKICIGFFILFWFN